MTEPPESPAAWTEADFQRIADSERALDNLLPHFAPRVIGMKREKRAIILSLASLPDTSDRGRIHVLLEGPPGTGRTSLLLAAAAETGTVVYGPRMSPGGATVDFRTGHVGVIGDAHKTQFQMLLLDEAEKLDLATLQQLLTAMESGQITYAGGGQAGMIPAHVRVIAAVNTLGRFPRELTDRFDHVIHSPLPTKLQAQRVVQGLAEGYMRPGAIGPIGFIRDYITWARAYQPAFPDTERRLAKHIFRILVDSEPRDEVRLRPYAGILRNAHALAQISRSDVTAERILEAVRLLHPDWHINRLDALQELLAFTRERGHRAAAWRRAQGGYKKQGPIG